MPAITNGSRQNNTAVSLGRRIPMCKSPRAGWLTMASPSRESAKASASLNFRALRDRYAKPSTRNSINTTSRMRFTTRTRTISQFRKRLRNCEIVRVRVVNLILDVVLMELRVEGFAYLSRSARKFNEALAFADSRDGEAMVSQPARGDLHIGIRRPKLTAVLFWRDPLVIAGIPWSVHSPQELLQAGFAFCRTVQDQKHSLRWKRIWHWALIVSCSGERMDCAVEYYELRLVDRFSNELQCGILSVRQIPEPQTTNQRARHCHQRERAGSALHVDHLNARL